MFMESLVLVFGGGVEGYKIRFFFSNLSGFFFF